jgi:hypothetical protein
MTYKSKQALGSATLRKIFLSFVISTSSVLASSPQLELFPVSVQASFKQAESQTLEMQNELTRISEEMKIQEKLYIESKCDQLSDDSGCRQLKSQMKDKYMELNTAVQKALPEVQRTVKHAHKTMGASLKRLSHKYTPSQLIKLNHEAMQTNNKPRQANTAKTPLGRMASLFGKINKAMGSKQTNLYVLASQTYADLTLIQNELALLEQNTANNAVVNSLGFNLDELNDESIDTIANYRVLVMGEEENFSTPVFSDQSSSQSYEDRLSNFY